jgi:hypothetical protein
MYMADISESTYVLGWLDHETNVAGKLEKEIKRRSGYD